LKDDNIAEPSEQLIVKLVPESVTGGAKAEGILHGTLLIEDSDNYYGIVEFGLDTDQKINIVSWILHCDIYIK